MKVLSEKCPVCESGNWVPHSDGVYIFRHGRKEHKVGGQNYALCDNEDCRARGYLPGQRDLNKSAIREYRSKLLGYISPSDILALREKYMLTQKQASLIFGGGIRSFSKWERGEAQPSGPTARLIKLALKSPIVLKELAEEAKVTVFLGAKNVEREPRQHVLPSLRFSHRRQICRSETVVVTVSDLPNAFGKNVVKSWSTRKAKFAPLN